MLRKVFDYLTKLYYRIIKKNFSRFPDLEDMLKRELVLYLMNIEEKIDENLSLQFEKESVVIFTKNPLYLDVLKKIKNCIYKEV